ncbi:hypothetical protein MesoLjLc_08590 [Mesorhizobium sp. L-8-10]|uniref:carboxymuconolactone decarboxylase family protein n=1 Tax=Mesorhizobium sp. L-8-10 TaxID=2744523 RepID=UPI001926E549|nr:carboxymuconolactone decarboxylase family protein [Mesorhizobium sp. L-8-10]BCH28929.1 hypothetical protein MesoLjLc_08590 [Mesorhizobium sp. L-8-10]
MSDDDGLTPDQLRRKEAFIAARGYWRPWTHDLLVIDPAFLEAYGRYAGYPAAHGPLSRRMVELVYVALDCSAAHMFAPGAALHIRLALEAGASRRDICDVLKLATARGLDGCLAGMDILSGELGRRGAASSAGPLSLEQAELRGRYIAIRGDWPGHCDYLLRRDAAFFALMLDMMAVRDDGEGLSPRDQVLIRIALAACFVALDRESLRAAIRQSLALDATQDEIEQVLQLTAHIAVHACAVGFPAMREACAALDRNARSC